MCSQERDAVLGHLSTIQPGPQSLKRVQPNAIPPKLCGASSSSPLPMTLFCLKIVSRSISGTLILRGGSTLLAFPVSQVPSLSEGTCHTF